MTITRRDFIHLVGASGVAAVLPPGGSHSRPPHDASLAALDAATASSGSTAPRGTSSSGDRVNAGAPRFRAIAFDAFPILDPRPVAAKAEALFPGRGAELVSAWRGRQFEYTWLRSLGGRYEDFWNVTDAALGFAAASLGLPLPPATRAQLMRVYLELRAWPDVLPALTRLSAAGVTLGFLSNFTPAMLDAGIRNAGLGKLLTHVVSTHAARTYKPDAGAYRLGVEAFGRPKEEILFVPFAGWDAAGAKWFGYPTFWVNRAGAAMEELGVAPDAGGRGLTELVDYVLA